jgi:uncharacterized membrane protein YidH (DUF202 family)
MEYTKMEIGVGYLLIIVGLIMIVAGALAWAGIIKVQRRGDGSTMWDFLIELLRQAPWVVVVGLVLIYIGCKMIGVPLPPTGSAGP